MTVNGHPDYARIIASMRAVAARVQPWSGTIYRSAPPRWSAGRHMLTGAGSKKSGARFNAPGSFPAVYGSTTPELAMIESLAFHRRAGLPVEEAMPLVFKAISVNVERLLDLTDIGILAELSLTSDQLQKEPWWLAGAQNGESLTQAVGRAAHTCSLQALLVSSARTSSQGHNIVVLPDHIRGPSSMRVLRRPPK